MWTRAELKNRAKMCLSRYYWAAFAVSLIFAILSGFGGSNANTQRVTSYLEQNATGSSRDDQSGLLIGELGGDGSLSGSTQSGLASGIELVPGLGDAYGPGAGNAGSMVASNLFYRLFAGAVVVIVIISVVIGIFVQPLFEIGRNRFYMESRVTGQSAGIGKLFWGFSNGYLKLLGTQFLRSLITEGIVFLCMAPGLLTLAFNRFLIDWMGSAVLMACGAVVGTCFSIYFQYCYLMVPYILAENPDMKAREALRLSKEMMDGQKVVKVFCHEEIAEEEFGWLNADLKEKQIRAQFFGGVMGPVMNNLSQLNYGLTACIGGLLCVFRNFDVGGLTVFLGFSRQFSRPINELSMQVGNVFSALAGAERVFSVLDAEPEAADAPDAVSIAPIRGEVVLDHVTFGYEPGQVILKDISLYAKPGQKIAFVGSTGAGKTTITNLINRFYDIQGGSITVDGVDVRRMHRKELRENIAMVLQDTHLFTGTVRENIRYGRLDATDEEVVEAAKTASAHSFIMRLPDGYGTMLEGDGANLSQGQRQLLNIARAAVSKAPILILDEATSSVDTRTEKHIEHGMDRLMADRTTFVIAHRLSTVRNANAIMVLEHGQIIERGDHEDLLAQKGRYFELYTGMKELE